jgi:hypothetical protein
VTSTEQASRTSSGTYTCTTGHLTLGSGNFSTQYAAAG